MCFLFWTQVSGLSYSVLHRDDSEVDKDQRPSPPASAPREVKKTRRKLSSATLSSKYRGYEELLTAKPDPDFIEPKGMRRMPPRQGALSIAQVKSGQSQGWRHDSFPDLGAVFYLMSVKGPLWVSWFGVPHVRTPGLGLTRLWGATAVQSFQPVWAQLWLEKCLQEGFDEQTLRLARFPVKPQIEHPKSSLFGLRQGRQCPL